MQRNYYLLGTNRKEVETNISNTCKNSQNMLLYERYQCLVDYINAASIVLQKKAICVKFPKFEILFDIRVAVCPTENFSKRKTSAKNYFGNRVKTR